MARNIMNKLSKYKPKSDTQEVAYSYHHFHNENVRIWVLAYFELEIFFSTDMARSPNLPSTQETAPHHSLSVPYKLWHWKSDG